MNGGISHKRSDESLSAKAKWFGSLPIEERMQVFCDFTEMILAVNPKILKCKHVKPIPGRIQVLTLK